MKIQKLHLLFDDMNECSCWVVAESDTKKTLSFGSWRSNPSLGNIKEITEKEKELLKTFGI